MNAQEIIRLARKYLGCGTMESSARLCMADAVRLEGEGEFEFAKARALKSLSYSVGRSHPDYQRASK